ncbi:hypothetical protein Dimus_019911 [Dionaea muscipula]
MVAVPPSRPSIIVSGPPDRLYHRDCRIHHVTHRSRVLVFATFRGRGCTLLTVVTPAKILPRLRAMRLRTFRLEISWASPSKESSNHSSRGPSPTSRPRFLDPWSMVFHAFPSVFSQIFWPRKMACLFSCCKLDSWRDPAALVLSRILSLTIPSSRRTRHLLIDELHHRACRFRDEVCCKDHMAVNLI